MKTWFLLALLGACARGDTPADAAPPPPEAPSPPPALADEESPQAVFDYEVWYGPGAEASAQLPTVVAVHGLGDRAKRFQSVFESCQLPLRVVAPQAPIPYGQGGSWYDGRSRNLTDEQLRDQLAGRAEQMATFLAQVEQTFPVKGRVAISGFSQGGMMSYAVAITQPQAISAAFPLAGLFPASLVPERVAGTPPIRGVHGLADEVLPYTRLAPGLAALTSAGGDVQVETFEGVAHSLPRPVRAHVCEEVSLWMKSL